MRWTVHGERAVYESPWMSVLLADIEIPGGKRFEHHLVRFPRPASAAVVHDRERGVLLLWRHRFITDRWGWEIPSTSASRPTRARPSVSIGSRSRWCVS